MNNRNFSGNKTSSTDITTSHEPINELDETTIPETQLDVSLNSQDSQEQEEVTDDSTQQQK